MCTRLNNAKKNYNIDDYVRVVGPSRWLPFRQYLFKALKLYWRSATVLQQYQVISDILDIEAEADDGSYTPKDLYEILEKDFYLIVRPSRSSAVSDWT